jgi:hypothetical protein
MFWYWLPLPLKSICTVIGWLDPEMDPGLRRGDISAIGRDGPKADRPCQL